MAKNIALQNLICIYSDNKDMLEKVDEKELDAEEEKKGNKALYEKKLIELEKRIQILRKQETDLMSELVAINQNLDTKKETVKIFDKQVQNFEAKIASLNEDLKLAKQFREKAKNEVRNLF